MTLSTHAAVVLAMFSLCALGCKEKPASNAPAPRTTTPTTGAAPKDDHGHDQDGHAGVIELGSATIGPYTVRATRDEGAIKAGGEAAIDVWVTGDSPKVSAVRFWIGTQDGAGAIKAKAEIEDPKEPNRWHTHAEVPEPMPAGAQLWVEIEDEAGKKSVGSFVLKA